MKDIYKARIKRGNGTTKRAEVFDYFSLHTFEYALSRMPTVKSRSGQRAIERRYKLKILNCIRNLYYKDESNSRNKP